MSEAAIPAIVPEEEPRVRAPQWQADLALVVAAFFFGTTFVVVKDAIDTADPVGFLAIRFLIAAAIIGVAARRRPATPKEIRHGVAAGLALGSAYILQTVGLQYTTSANSAFLTYLMIVMVPLLAFIFLRRRPHPTTILATATALIGLILLTSDADVALGKGEIYTLLCAVGFASHLLILGETTGHHDPLRLTFIQLFTVGVCCTAIELVASGGTALGIGGGALLAALFTGIFATALAFLAMAWAQRVVSAARAAIILLLEPVFAALVAWLTGDKLPPATLLGGAFIMLAVVVSEFVPMLTRLRSSITPRQ